MHRLFGWLQDFDSLRSVSECDLALDDVVGPSPPWRPMLGLATTAAELDSVVHLKDRDEQLGIVHGRDGITEEFLVGS
jgi:hypothetical protein